MENEKTGKRNGLLRVEVIKGDALALPTVTNTLVGKMQTSQDNARKEENLEYIEPEKDPEELLDLINNSGILPQVIEALAVGIYGVGFELKNRFPELEKEPRFKAEIEAEKNRLIEFLESADLSGRFSWNELLRTIGTDLESSGNAYIEVLKNKGRPYGFSKLDCRYMRLIELDPEIVFWDQPFYDLDTKSYKFRHVPARFRRYVQISPQDGSVRYFKSLGDPRIVDHLTGEYWTYDQWARLPDKQKQKIIKANEIWHFCLYSPSSPYGAVRWRGAINSCLGSIYKELNDLGFFKNGAKCDLAITSNAGISPGSVEILKEKYLKSGAMNDIDNAHHALILLPDDESLENAGAENNKIEIDVKELNVNRDSQYDHYDERNEERVVSSCRLSVLHIGGKTKGFNRSNSQSMQETVESNTFLPAREKIDSFINNQIFPLLQVKYHKYKSKSSTRQSKKDLSEVYEKVKEDLTYRERRTVAAPLVETTLTDVEADWLDKPKEIALGDIQNQKKKE